MKDDSNGKIELDELEYHMDLVNSWILNTDNKINISFAILSVIFSAFGIFTSTKISKLFENDVTFLKILFSIFAIMSIFIFLISLRFFYKSLKPNVMGTKECGYVGQDLNILFFNNVRHLSYKCFYNRYKHLNLDKYKDYLIEEIYYNSLICSKKMHNFSIGIKFGATLILLVIISFIILVLI